MQFWGTSPMSFSFALSAGRGPACTFTIWSGVPAESMTVATCSGSACGATTGCTAEGRTTSRKECALPPSERWTISITTQPSWHHSDTDAIWDTTLSRTQNAFFGSGVETVCRWSF